MYFKNPPNNWPAVGNDLETASDADITEEKETAVETNAADGDFLPSSSRCPLCDSSSIHPAFEVRYWKEFVFRYFDCSQCRATFANPMPSDALISRGNSALVRLYQSSRTEEDEFREARQAYLRGKVLASKLRKWKKSGRLLELGCYHAFYSLGVRENSNWEVEGLEISPELCVFIRERLKIPCTQGTLENSKIDPGRYDYVICHDLIEHVNQPGQFLSRLSEILAPGGRVRILTPNARQDLAHTRRAFRQGYRMGMLLNHILYFEPRTLRLALEKNGLRVRCLSSFKIQHAPRDFGWFGLGPVQAPKEPPSMQATLRDEMRGPLLSWTDNRIESLRNHPKTSVFYGFFREVFPDWLTLKIPEAIGIGHEIVAEAEKPLIHSSRE